MQRDIKSRIHKKLLHHNEKLVNWYQGKLKRNLIPFYASFDLRDAGFKIGNVDGNVFPAGFNNICQLDKDQAPEIAANFLKCHYPEAKNLLLLAETHLRNPHYWDNVAVIKEILIETGHKVDVGMFFTVAGDSTIIESFKRQKIKVYKIQSKEGQLFTTQGRPDLVIINNDFSNPYNDIDFSATKMNPLRELGWYQRRKHCFFEYYNSLVCEFAQLIEEDPWLFEVPTQRLSNFDITDKSCQETLASKVDEMVKKVKEKYEEYNIDENPYVFVKNNSGTYGLGVVEVGNGDEIRNLNYKSKKKLKVAKGGGGVSEVIIQEGIPSIIKQDEAIAEPVLYMIGDELVGGFLRTHENKNSYESLNSPGAVYKRLCLSDLKVQAEGCILENVYGWLAKIGLLAITREVFFYKPMANTVVSKKPDKKLHKT